MNYVYKLKLKALSNMNFKGTFFENNLKYKYIKCTTVNKLTPKRATGFQSLAPSREWKLRLGWQMAQKQLLVWTSTLARFPTKGGSAMLSTREGWL